VAVLTAVPVRHLGHDVGTAAQVASLIVSCRTTHSEQVGMPEIVPPRPDFRRTATPGGHVRSSASSAERIAAYPNASHEELLRDEKREAALNAGRREPDPIISALVVLALPLRRPCSAVVSAWHT
jgi:hypothetical protein